MVLEGGFRESFESRLRLEYWRYSTLAKRWSIGEVWVWKLIENGGSHGAEREHWEFRAGRDFREENIRGEN